MDKIQKKRKPETTHRHINDNKHKTQRTQTRKKNAIKRMHKTKKQTYEQNTTIQYQNENMNKHKQT